MKSSIGHARFVLMCAFCLTLFTGCGQQSCSSSSRYGSATQPLEPEDEALRSPITNILQQQDLSASEKEDRIVDLLREVYPEQYQLIDQAGSLAGLRGTARTLVAKGSDGIEQEIGALRAGDRRRIAYRHEMEKRLSQNPEWQKVVAEGIALEQEIRDHPARSRRATPPSEIAQPNPHDFNRLAPLIEQLDQRSR